MQPDRAARRHVHGEPRRERPVRRRRGGRGHGRRDGAPRARRACRRCVATRSSLYPDTERAMGWDVGGPGLQHRPRAPRCRTWSRATSAATSTPSSADHGLEPHRHRLRGSRTPAGPRSSRRCRTRWAWRGDALARAPGARWPRSATCPRPRCCTSSPTRSRDSRRRPAAYGVLLAMGPGFCSELVLLRGERGHDPQRAVHCAGRPVGVERLAELAVSKRHRGAGPSRSRVLSTDGATTRRWWRCTPGCWSAAWSRSSWPTGPFLPALGWPMLALVVAAQALRWWCIATLGPQWNTRVIVVPGAGAGHRAGRTGCCATPTTSPW